MASRHWWAPPNSNSEQELHQWCLRMWHRMDRDNSGSLTRQELDCEEFYAIVRTAVLPNKQALEGMGGAGYSRAVMDMGQAIDFALRKADINNDGKLSFDEFKAFILTLRQPHLATHTANLIFSLFDVNRDGFVDESEFKQIYRFYLGRAPPETDFRQEWAGLDQANRGRVSREDYVKWLRTSGKSFFRDHAPQPQHLVMSGTTDFHEVKREGLATPTAMVAMSATAPGPWRPWQAYSNHGWNQRKQGPVDVHTTSTNSRGPMTPSTTGTFSSTSAQQRMSRSTGSLARPRPPWNQHLATANPNLPNHTHGLEAKATRPKGVRQYISPPQSPSELKRHFQESPGFEKHLKRISQPEPSLTFGRQSRLSTDRIEVGQAPEMLPTRSRFKHGRMKNPKTGKREHWEDNWQTPPLMKDKYVNGSNSLKHIGEPPRWLYIDEYEDPE